MPAFQALADAHKSLCDDYLPPAYLLEKGPLWIDKHDYTNTLCQLAPFPKQAMQFLQQACKQINATVLQLEVKQDNPQAAALYEKLGFEQQERNILTKTIASDSND